MNFRSAGEGSIEVDEIVDDRALESFDDEDVEKMEKIRDLLLSLAESHMTALGAATRVWAKTIVRNDLVDMMSINDNGQRDLGP